MLWLKKNCNEIFSSAGEYFRATFMHTHTDNSKNIDTGYEEYDTNPVYDQDAIRYKVAGFGENLTLSRWEKKVLVGNDKNRIFDWVLSKTTGFAKGMTRKLAVKCIWGDAGTGVTTAKRVIPLRLICDNTQTSYGGIGTVNGVAITNSAHPLYPYTDSTTTTISWTTLQLLYIGCGAETEVFLTSKEIFGYLLALRIPAERYTPSESTTQFANVGAPVISFLGIPIVWDANINSTNYSNGQKYLFALTSKPCTDSQGKGLLYFTHNEYDLSLEHICDSTSKQDISVERSEWAGQLLCPNRKRQGMLTAIAG